jgi:hypothetical protein
LTQYQPLVQTQPAQVSASSLERGLFHHYLTEVIDHVADDFNRSLWAVHLPRSAKEQPAIWHACVAVAALHQRQPFCGTRKSELYTTALNQYHKSLQSLIKLKPSASSKDEYAVQVPILGANLLFIVCAVQRGEITEAFTHLRNAINLLQLWRFWEPVIVRPPWKTPEGIIPKGSLMLFYVQIDGLAMEILPTRAAWHWQWEQAVVSIQQEPLVSLVQACLEIEMIWIGIKGMCNTIPLRCSPTQCMDFNRRRAILAAYYQKWAVRFDQFKDLSSAPDEANWALWLTLEVRRIVVSLMFRVDISGFETCWDALEPDFEAIASLIESIEERTLSEENMGRKAPYAFTPSLTKSLFFLVKVCRPSSLRRRIIKLYIAHRQRQRIISQKQDLTFYVEGVLAIMKIEEGAWGILEEERPATCSCRKHVFICNEHRIFECGIIHTGTHTANLPFRTVGDVAHGRETRSIPLTHMMPQ